MAGGSISSLGGKRASAPIKGKELLGLSGRLPLAPLAGAQIEELSDRDRYDLRVNYTRSVSFPLPDGGTFTADLPDGTGYVSVQRVNGRMEIMTIGVGSQQQGRGVARAMIGKALVDSRKRGAELTTSGVLSRDGRRLFEGLVRDGLARRDGDNYIVTG